MGFMGSCPIAGVIWQHVHYIVGLNRLGHDVYYIEDSARLPYNPQTFDTNNDYGYAGKILSCLAREFGFQRRWSFCARYLPKNPTVGLPLKTIRQLYRDADAIFNVCGTQEFNDDLRRSDRLLYIESDPGVEQIKVDQAQEIDHRLSARDITRLFTFGENVGTKNFPVPLHGIKWLPTRQPIVTDLWKTSRRPAKGAVLTTIANWSTSGLKDIVWRGENFSGANRASFFALFLRRARRGETFEMATDIKDAKTRERFLRNGWRFCFAARDERRLLGLSRLHPAIERRIHSRERSIRPLHTGWFSDRSACYLAAGRPVITQETGFTDHYGGGAGLLVFNSLGEISKP